MHARYYKLLLLFVLLLVSGCSSETVKKKHTTVKGEYLIRQHHEYFFTPPPPLPRTRETYPWEDTYVGGFPRITKEFFRCKGNPLNPVATQEREGKETLYYRDCHGGRRHGLPLKNNEEFIYPCLIDLLNYIQEQTRMRVVVTTGHRCPIHNSYCDYSSYNWGSKHMLGAEVDFYVVGMEEKPEAIIQLVMDYYKGDADYEVFTRFERGKLNVSTPPWYNKEIFIKLYQAHEGRDHDNQHPYPYISIQVRHDKETGSRVTFTQEQAQNYLRH